MRRVVWNGPGLNASVITVLRAASRSSEGHNVAEPVKGQWPMNWTDTCELWKEG